MLLKSVASCLSTSLNCLVILSQQFSTFSATKFHLYLCHTSMEKKRQKQGLHCHLQIIFERSLRICYGILSSFSSWFYWNNIFMLFKIKVNTLKVWSQWINFCFNNLNFVFIWFRFFKPCRFCRSPFSFLGVWISNRNFYSRFLLCLSFRWFCDFRLNLKKSFWWVTPPSRPSSASRSGSTRWKSPGKPSDSFKVKHKMTSFLKFQN